MEDEPQQRSHTQQGTVYVFANVYMYPEKPGVTGKFKKFNVVDRQDRVGNSRSVPELGWRTGDRRRSGVLWQLGRRLPCGGSCDGKMLWSRKLGSGIIGNPITYSVKGKQYVSVWSGIGGWIGLPVTAGLDLSDKFGAIGATGDDQGGRPEPHSAGWYAVHLQDRRLCAGQPTAGNSSTAVRVMEIARCRKAPGFSCRRGRREIVRRYLAECGT